MWALYSVARELSITATDNAPTILISISTSGLVYSRRSIRKIFPYISGRTFEFVLVLFILLNHHHCQECLIEERLRTRDEVRTMIIALTAY